MSCFSTSSFWCSELVECRLQGCQPCWVLCVPTGSSRGRGLPHSSVTHEHLEGEVNTEDGWDSTGGLEGHSFTVRRCVICKHVKPNITNFSTLSLCGVFQIKRNWATASLWSVFLGQLCAFSALPEVSDQWRRPHRASSGSLELWTWTWIRASLCWCFLCPGALLTAVLIWAEGSCALFWGFVSS